MKNREKPRMSKPRAFALLLIGLLCLSFVASLSYRLYSQFRGGGVDRSDITVQVLNGCGVDKLAQEVSEILRLKGFDVVDFANAPSGDQEKTVVIERATMDRSNAMVVARAIKCSNVTCEIDPLGLFEVTVVLGKDYERLFGKHLSSRGL